MGRGAAARGGFEERLDELWRCAFRAAYRVLRSTEAAEDVAEEALIRAYPRWPSIEGHAEPWITRVAVNLAISTWRHEHRRPTVEAAAAGGAGLAVGDRTVERVDLLAALGKLSARQRQVLALRYLVDLTDGDIAHALGCSTGAVKRHAARGLARLRTQLGDEPGVELHPRPGGEAAGALGGAGAAERAAPRSSRSEVEPVTSKEASDGC